MKTHYEESISISEVPDKIFSYIDDHNRFSSHMTKSSWMTGGGRMDVSIDKGHGQKVGSLIRMSGTVFGIKLFLNEIVTHHKPPFVKTWETVGTPKLLVIGQYKMKVEIKPQKEKSLLIVSIDYDLPEKNAWLGKIFGGMYAKWCVNQMITGVRNYFG